MATGAVIPVFRPPSCLSRLAFCVYRVFSAAWSQGFEWGRRPCDPVALMLRSRAHARGVSKHEGKGIARLILRDGASRLLRMRLPKHRRERRAGSLYFPVFLRRLDACRRAPPHPSRRALRPLLRMRRLPHRARGSSKPAPRTRNLTMSNSPSRSRARIAASGLCLFASLTPR
jgi:hypothetical protein